MNKFDVGFYVGAVLAAVASVLCVIFQPILFLAVVGAAIFFGSFFLKDTLFHLFHVSVIFALAVGIPMLRLTSEQSQLKLIVPAVLAVSGTALWARVKYRPSAGLTWVLIVSFLVQAFATSREVDSYEWQSLALTITVVYASLAVAGSTTKLKLWRSVAGVMITIAAAQAALGLFELMYMVEPLWRGALILADGQSVALRNDIFPSLMRAQGTLGHPLPYAFTLIVGCIVLLRSERGHGFWRFLLWALLAAGVLASGSRNAIVLFVVATLLGMIRPQRVGGFTFATLLALIGSVLGLPFIMEQVDRLAGSGSVYHRVGAIHSIERLNFLRDFSPSMIGDGAASTPRLFSDGLLQSDGLEAVDNQYVYTLAQEGIFGLMVVIIIFLIAFKRADSTLRLLLFAVFVECMIFDLLFWPSMAVYAWVFIGVAIGRKPDPKEPREVALSSQQKQLQLTLKRNARLHRI